MSHKIWLHSAAWSYRPLEFLLYGHHIPPVEEPVMERMIPTGRRHRRVTLACVGNRQSTKPDRKYLSIALKARLYYSRLPATA